MVLLSQISGVKAVTRTLIPGQDLIKQQRDDREKFVKRT